MKSFISAFWKAGVVAVFVAVVVSGLNYVLKADNTSDENNPAPFLYITVKNLNGSPQGQAQVWVTLPNGQEHPYNGQQDKQFTNSNGKVNFPTYGPGTYIVTANYPERPNDYKSGRSTAIVVTNYEFVDIILDTFY